MSAPTLSGLRLSCDRMHAGMFDQDPQDLEAIANAAGLAMDGIRKVAETGDPAGLEMAAEAQERLAAFSPFTRVAVASYITSSLVNLGCDQLRETAVAEGSGQPTAPGLKIGARMVRRQLKIVRPALKEAACDNYAPGRQGVNIHIAGALAEAMLEDGDPAATAPHILESLKARSPAVLYETDASWLVAAQRRIVTTKELAKTRARVYRPGIQEMRIADALEAVQPGLEDIGPLLADRGNVS